MSTGPLGTTLREHRTRRGLSQQALARRAGVSRTFLAQIERGESTPTVAVLLRLATALGVAAGTLLGEDPPPPPGGETVGVPLVADTIAAGPPAFVADHLEGTGTLPRDLLHSLGVDTRLAVLVRLGPDQDSMADTIPPGSTVLVDRAAVSEIVPRGIYAVREEVAGETGATVKRLVLDAPSRVLILLSDNPAHLPRALRLRAGQPLGDVVIGRVVWWTPPAPSTSSRRPVRW